MRAARSAFGRRPYRLPVLLKTLGHPALHRADGALAGGLRRKDLALLVYLCVEGLPVHARGRLAALLWGESTEERARHSLTQAVGRLLRVLPAGVLAPDKDAVRWTGGLPCDAVALLRERMEPKDVDDAFWLYAGHFLEGFDPGAGAQDFREWADRRRAELRNAALRLLDRAGERAEAAGSWGRALRLGERAVEIDPLWEQGHRRIMRALAARGERNGALRHYQRLEAYLEEEVGGRPDPDTRALAEHLRAPDASRAAPPPPPPGPVPDAAPVVDAAADPAPGPDADPPAVEEPALSAVAGGAAAPQADPLEAFVVPSTWESADSPVRVRSVPAEGRRVSHWLWIALAGALAAAVATAAWDRRAKGAAAAERPPTHGESVRMRGSQAIYLAFGHTLYRYPDASTLHVCTGGYPDVVREVRRLPRWPRRVLPTVLEHAWLGGALPVVSDHPQDKTAYVLVGCILPGVPDPPTLDSIFGPEALGRMLEVPDSVLRRLPRAFIARGHPLRPAGTLIRAPDGRIRWITYHGGALEVADPGLLATHCRAANQAVSVTAREFLYYKAWGRLGPSPAKCPPPG